MNDLKDMFYTILACSFSGTFAGAAVLLFRRLTERLISPNWKCIMWAIPVLLLLVPFKIPLNLGGANAVQLSNATAINSIKELPDYFSSNANDANTRLPKQNSGTKEQAASNNGAAVNTQLNNQATGNQEPFNQPQNVSSPGKLSVLNIASFILNNMIPFIWLMGFAVMLAFLLLGVIRLNSGIKRTSAGAADERILRIVNQCRDIMKLKRPLTVIVQSHIKASALVGLFHPKIVLPAYITGLDEETLRYIVLHELSHYKRRDAIINYLLIIVQAVHWFNPFIWYCCKNIRQDMELATDAMVLSYLQDTEHKQYALSLLRVIGTEQGIAMAPKILCMADSPRNIKRRISMIQLNGFFKKKPVLVSLSCILVMALAGTVFFTVKPLQPADNPSAAVADSGSPDANRYASLCFLNDSTGWVVQSGVNSDEDIQLLSTADGGNSWTEVYNGALEFTDLNFISRQVGWAIVRIDDRLYSIDKTADGGETWVDQTQCAVYDYGNNNTKIKFFDLNNGYALIGDKLLKTSDSGNTWTEITPADGFVLIDCSFVNAAAGWVCGTLDGNISAFNTTDGGDHWTQKFSLTASDAGSTKPLEINFINETTGWILLDNPSADPSNPTLYRTSDGGDSFVGICNVAGNRPYLADICFADADIGFVGTDHGAGPISGGLMMTTDGGKTFSYLFNSGGIDRIVFPSPEVGYAIGYNDDNMCRTGFIIRTTDGGKSWRQISEIAPAIGISFVDGKNGFGIGTGFDPGAFLKTTDGGATWSYAYDFSPECLYTAGISFISKTTGYVIASSPDGYSMENDLYKTTDGGGSWVKAGKVSVYCDYFKMFDENNGIASGLGAGSMTYSKTTDGGRTWAAIPIKSGDSLRIVPAFSSTEQGIISYFDYQAQTVTFTDFRNGNAGNPITTFSNMETGCDGIYMLGNKVVILMSKGQSPSYSEAIIISNDGGATWEQIPLSAKTGDILMQVKSHRNSLFLDFPDSMNGFIMVPGYSSLLCTTDGGNTWRWR
jgi:beta-lactamase regulating signal transducer with metallopeptidase domain/photosystem II stability/assembly factor-like uncharacterized protein